MGIELRHIGEDEFKPLVRAVGLGFGMQVDEDTVAALSRPLRLGRTIAALDDGEIVGGATVFSLDMNTPEGRSAPTAVVSNVAVLPTHRRRGILTRMMDCHLREAHERGEVAAILGASESIIYGRFGYGVAAQHERWSIGREHTALEFSPSAPGRLRFIEKDAALDVLLDVAARACADRPGFVPLHADHTSEFMADLEHDRRGASALQFVVFEEDGRANGHVIYRLDGETVLVIDLMATTDAAYAALWRFCFGIDLRTQIEAQDRPVDDALPWMLADPRRLERVPYDGMWLRMLDVRKALEARDFAANGRLVLEVLDEFCPWNAGRYELEAGLGGARCEPTTAVPNITLPASSLASIYLGGVELSTLVRASRAEVDSPETMYLADAMFRARLKPWWPHGL